MNNYQNISNNLIWKELSSLSRSVNKSREKALKTRLKKNPQLTNLEYLLGAFMEMFEPHLVDVVTNLSEKGYALSVFSGFSGKNAEYQSLIGNIHLDYITRNKLERLGIRHKDYNGSKSYSFLPEYADLDYILEKWHQFAKTLPDRGQLDSIYITSETIKFRRKYSAQSPDLQKKQKFEKLRFDIRKKTELELDKRMKNKKNPDAIELSLGLFKEELEPQVRNAVLALYRKGYSIDISGFMDNPIYQVIEGDFQLDEKTLAKFNPEKVTIETNPSGYTSLRIAPTKADLKNIQKEWDKIIALFPDTKKSASASMTRKAREFRLEYA